MRGPTRGALVVLVLSMLVLLLWQLRQESQQLLDNQRQLGLAYSSQLANHLSHLVFVSNQYLFDQQRSMFFFHEQLKQVEIAKWLSSKTADERHEYLERMRVESTAPCGKFV